jgi:hypothetical protein
MTTTFSIWIVVVLAFVAANVPFLTQRLMGVLALKHDKNFGVRMLELVLCGGCGRTFS